MLTVVSDTHGRESTRLEGRTREAVHEAAVVVHAGDFMTETVLDGFHDAADTLHAVSGNNDPPVVRDRVPARRVLEFGGVRFVVVHGHEHGGQALSLAAREVGADCAVVGHSHRPGLHQAGDLPVLNPGSHAEPRRYRPAHAELRARPAEPVLDGRLVQPDGTLLEEFEIGGTGPTGTR